VLANRVTQAMANGVEELVEADILTQMGIYLRAMWPEVFSKMMKRRAALSSISEKTKKTQ